MVTVSSTPAFENLWYIWRLFGMHPPDGDSFWARHYTAYRICIVFFSNVNATISIYIVCLLSRNLAEFCETYYAAALIFLEQIKLLNAWSKLGRFKNIQRTINQMDIRLESIEEQDIIRDHVRRSKQLFLWVMRSFLSIFFSAVLLVVFTGELPVLTWYPWDWKSSTSAYIWTVIYQVICIFAVCMMAIINDSYPMAYLTMIAGHFRALAFRISVLGYSGAESETKAYDKLTSCIRDHQSLLLLVESIQDALSTIFFFQFAVTASSLCTLTYYVLFVNVNSTKSIHLTFNVIGCILETFVICYATEEVDNAAEELCSAIYDCNWYSRSGKFKRTLSIMLNRSQRPVIIVAAQIVPVRMTTFLAVVKSAYSMFTLLTNLKSQS